MNIPKEFIQYLVYFHGNRDYFECHEVLEEYWKKVDSTNRASIWVGFIQVAVAMYHYRRNNLNGAQRTLMKGMTNLQLNDQKLATLGVEKDRFLSILHDQMKRINEHKPYQSINIPLIDEDLIRTCINLCDSYGYRWRQESDLSNSLIVHKHQLRDRSDVISAREKALKNKNG
ncbi:DUF309 domain-containing protein [Bacillus spongiae]|uniref:DUF309 domain-containing protein n=1 Tax=Bacillus spongiae TaxID=2683610 RepID=A0ABU8HCX4_9BACI